MRLVALVLAITFVAAAQPQGCFGDDGFAAVPWCQPIQQNNLPQFPQTMQLGGRYCCLLDCALENDFQVGVVVTNQPILCDYYLFSVSVVPMSATAPSIVVPFLFGKYSRTWIEPSPTTGAGRQVYRFLINGDANFMPGPTGAPGAPCPRPPCSVPPTSLPVHLVGHVDYACEPDPTSPAGVTWSMALNLNHWCGGISHLVWGDRPLAGPPSHPNRSYHLVAPGAFVCQPAPAPQGPILAEAVRTSSFNIPGAFYTWLGEVPVLPGPNDDLTTQSLDCLCPAPSAVSPLIYEHQNLKGTAWCGTASPTPFSNFPLPAGLPPGLPTGFVAQSIGSWTNPTNVFPGTRQLHIYWGILQYADPCDPASFPLHIVTGVGTSGVPGFTFTGPVPPVPFLNFIDLHDCLKLNSIIPGTIVGPTWGGLFLSQVVWNLNVP